MRFTHGRLVLVPVLFAGIVLLGGCTGGTAPSPAKKGGEVKKEHDDHSGWWCPEHSLPEDVCDLCDKKYRDAEKAKGNWCEHNRVKTSCFQCNPGLKDYWAKVYEEKFGKKPPEPPEENAKEKGTKR